MTTFTVLIVTAENTDNRKVKKALISNGYDHIRVVSELAAIGSMADVVIAFVDFTLADATLYQELQTKQPHHFIPILVINAPTNLTLVQKNNLLLAGFADVLTGSQVTINTRLQYFLREAEREKAFLESKIDSQQFLKHIESEREVAVRMFDTICKSSCFKSTNLTSNYSPERLFNGDLLLATHKPDNDMIVFLGDFTSHGLPMAIGAIPASETFLGMSRKGFSFESIINEINRKLKKILPPEIYCAAAVIEINLKKQICKLWNGGLPELILTDGAGQMKRRFPANHPPLAVLREHEFNADTIIFEFSETDRLFSFTGGAVKSCDHQGVYFDEKNLEQCFKESIAADRLYHHIVNTLSETLTRQAVEEATVLELLFTQTEETLNPVQPKSKRQIKSLDWSLDLKLPPHALRNLDPLPVLLHILMEQPALDAHRSQIYAILAELFSNALDHGVLGLNSKQKSDINGFAEYYQARTENLAALTDAEVTIHLQNIPDDDGGRLVIQLEDSGPGFDYHKKLQNFTENKGYCGRGMAMIHDMCESVEYSGRGNIVRVVYRW